MIGGHLQDLVRAELRAQNFQIKAEGNVKVEGKKGSESEHGLDIIARHKTKEITIGVEIKGSVKSPSDLYCVKNHRMIF